MVLEKIDVGKVLDGFFVIATVTERIDEKLEELLYKKSGGAPTSRDNCYYVCTVVVAALSVDGLCPVVVLIGDYDKREGERVRISVWVKELPAGECPGNLFDIVFGIVRFAGNDVFDAHRKQLLQFAGEIFVWAGLNICDAVQPDQHRRILGHREQQIVKSVQTVSPERQVLQVHENVLDL